LATFHSFVNATYSDISVDCNDFYAGFCRICRNNLILHCKKANDIWTKNDNNTIPIIKHHNSNIIYTVYSSKLRIIVCVYFKNTAL